MSLLASVKQWSHRREDVETNGVVCLTSLSCMSDFLFEIVFFNSGENQREILKV